LPVDPQIQTLLDRAAGVPATHTLPLAAARTQAESRVALMAPPAEIAGTAMRQVRDVLKIFAQRCAFVLGAEQTALLQFGNYQIDKIVKAAGWLG
jgi:hypothetical protein